MPTVKAPNRMEITREEFMMLYERLLDRLDALERRIDSLATIGGKQMLDNRDMRLLLKVCDRTLLRWRRSRNLRGFRISGKVYYMAADVHQFLRSKYYQEEMNLRNNKNHSYEKEQ